MNVYKLSASQLVNLLQVLGALVADYHKNPKKPANPELVPFLKSSLAWSQLESLPEAIRVARSGGDKLSALYQLGIDLKVAMPEFKEVRDYTSPELQMLNALRTYLQTDSAPAMNYIVRNASIFGSKLAPFFAPDTPDTVDHSRLQKAVKSLVGRNGVYLTPEEATLLKETDPKGYANYVTLRKQHTQDFKAMLMAYVRESGEKLVPYKELYSHFVKLGFTHSLVPGFTGLVDDQGRWYTVRGEPIAGQPTLQTYSQVVMTKDSDGQSVFVAVKPTGETSHFYTVAFAKNQSAAKYERVSGLMKNIKTIRAKWFAKVKGFDITDKLSVASVVLEILYGFAARIGSAPGRGAGTLLVRNVRETADGYNLFYNGKDNIPTKHVLKRSDAEQALVVSAIGQLLEGKNKTDFLFTYTKPNGAFARVSPSDVNAAFRAFGAPAEVSVHKLRTLRGTTLFKMLMDKDKTKRPPKDQKEALLRYKKYTEEVGKLLNHKRGVGGSNEKVTGTTAANAYIDKNLQSELWQNWGIRPPAALEKLFVEHKD